MNSPTSRFPRVRVFLAQGLVIVVSVLVALAADRMVMGIDEKAQERTYLQGLLEDLTAIEQTMEYAMRSAAMRDTAAVLVLSTIRRTGSDDVSGIQLAKALELAGWVMDHQFARDTWDDMVGTGRLGILHNPELRREVSAFYRQIDQDVTFLSANALMSGLSAGLLQRLRGGSFRDGLARGALGGSVKYAGMRASP